MTIKSSVAILYGPRSAEYNIRMNEATIRHRNLTEIPAWQRLAAHYRDRPFDLAAMFAQDPRRAHTLSAHCGEVLLDYSKNLLDAETLRLLIELARERDLAGAIGRLFSGEPVNVSENRAALHTALRSESPVHLDGRDITVSIKTEIDRMRTFVESIRAAKTVTDVIHIGIGGARLGAAFAGDALQAYATTPLRVHYLSTVDGGALQQLLARLDPKYTLIIVASKTFTTAETQANAHAVRDWMAGKLGGEQAALAKFSAVTARPEIAEAFGIAAGRAIERVGAGHLRHRDVRTLSAGERQLVAVVVDRIRRVIRVDPDVRRQVRVGDLRTLVEVGDVDLPRAGVAG